MTTLRAATDADLAAMLEALPAFGALDRYSRIAGEIKRRAEAGPQAHCPKCGGTGPAAEVDAHVAREHR